VRLEGLGILKKSTSSGFEPATFLLVAKCLNQRFAKKKKTTGFRVPNLAKLYPKDVRMFLRNGGTNMTKHTVSQLGKTATQIFTSDFLFS
jgi:hypothetical protein